MASIKDIMALKSEGKILSELGSGNVQWRSKDDPRVDDTKFGRALSQASSDAAESKRGWNPIDVDKYKTSNYEKVLASWFNKTKTKTKTEASTSAAKRASKFK